MKPGKKTILFIQKTEISKYCPAQTFHYCYAIPSINKKSPDIINASPKPKSELLSHVWFHKVF